MRDIFRASASVSVRASVRAHYIRNSVSVSARARQKRVKVIAPDDRKSVSASVSVSARARQKRVKVLAPAPTLTLFC